MKIEVRHIAGKWFFAVDGKLVAFADRPVDAIKRATEFRPEVARLLHTMVM